MANAQNNNAMYILSRNNYNARLDPENYRLNNNSIYFVRENSSDNAQIISLYVGKSKQCDLLDLTYTEQFRVEVKDDVLQQEQGETSYHLSYSYIFPKTIKVLLNGANYAADDGNGNIKLLDSDNLTETIVATINYGTGYIIFEQDYQSLATNPNLKFKYFYYTVNFTDTEQFTIGEGEEYKIKDKMFLLEQFLDSQGNALSDPYYRIFMWDANLGRFLNCSPEQLVFKDGTLGTTNQNIISGTDMPLASIIHTESGIPSGAITLEVLPRNGGEFRVAPDIEVSSITITDVTRMEYYQGRSIPIAVDVKPDYTSFIVFKRMMNGGATSASELMGNFAPDSTARIYLLNPEKDISAFSVIHILLYHDGMNICAIVTGYNDNSNTP